MRFIARSKDQPFFLYLPHFGVHTPIQGRADLVEKYQAKRQAGLTHTNAAYAAMIESVDATVGRIRAALDEHKLADRTIIVFTSDNGGRVPTTSNLPLRAGKGSCYEGGTRVPLIVHWPGVTKPGSICDVPVISVDLYPTLLEAAGVEDRPGHRPDGVSLVPLLRQTGGLERDALFWHYPHHQHYQQGGAMPYSAVRAGRLQADRVPRRRSRRAVQPARRPGRAARPGDPDAGQGEGTARTPPRLAGGGRGPDADAEPEVRPLEAPTHPHAAASRPSASARSARPPSRRARLPIREAGVQARISRTTRPWTSVRRKSRPA